MGLLMLNGIPYSGFTEPSNIYSTTEREVGVWIDGKPVYEKTYDLGADTAISSTSWTEIDANYPTNCQLLIHVDALTSGGTYASGISLGKKSNGKFEMQSGRNNGYDQSVRYFTIQYTKTTDVPGSGKYAPNPANNYHVLSNEWSSYVSSAINHTFTAYQKGQYLVVSAIGDNGDSNNNITSTGTLVYQRYSTNPGARHAFVNLYNLNANETITVKSDNYSGGAYRGTNAIICRIDGPQYITSLSVTSEGLASDGTVSKTTYLTPGKFYITIGISAGIDESSSDSVSGSYAENSIISYYTRIHFIQSISGSQITQTQYGNQAGSANIGVYEVTC